jgi:gluconate kinase
MLSKRKYEKNGEKRIQAIMAAYFHMVYDLLTEEITPRDGHFFPQKLSKIEMLFLKKYHLNYKDFIAQYI